MWNEFLWPVSHSAGEASLEFEAKCRLSWLLLAMGSYLQNVICGAFLHSTHIYWVRYYVRYWEKIDEESPWPHRICRLTGGRHVKYFHRVLEPQTSHGRPPTSAITFVSQFFLKSILQVWPTHLVHRCLLGSLFTMHISGTHPSPTE